MSSKVIVITCDTAYQANSVSSYPNFTRIALVSGKEVDVNPEEIIAIVGYTRRKWHEYTRNKQWSTQG